MSTNVSKKLSEAADWKKLEQSFRDFVGSNPITEGLAVLLAFLWRRLLFRTTFVVVSGSVGKTTAKDAIALVLSRHLPTQKTDGSRNHNFGLARSILRIRPWHRIAVIEIGLNGPGEMKRLAYIARPDIAVWTNVARTHTQSFRTLEAIAKEKSLLIESLRPGGVAILNSDNPFIAAYQPANYIKTIRYGTSPGMDWQASNVSSNWPERLSFFVQNSEQTATISTKLVGKHWLPSVLPALVVAREMGLNLEQSRSALTELESMEQRLSPATTRNGVTFLRDEWNGSVDTLTVALEVLKDATAKRKILVFSDVSDSVEKVRRRQRRIGAMAKEVADAALFVGDAHEHAVRGAIDSGMSPDQVWGFYDIREASEHLRSELREGDLVLLRGRTVDHLSRLYLAMSVEVTCWLPACKKKCFCDVCPELQSKKLA